MFRKYGFIILSVYTFGDDMNLNVFIMAILSFLTLIFQAQKNPFEFRDAISISLFVHIIILFSVFGIMILKTNSAITSQLLFVFLFVVLNTVLMWRWALDIYLLKKKDLVNRISLIKNSIWSIFSSSSRGHKTDIVTNVIRIK